ncbi:LapA family protein [Pseudogracilibacillus sp. SO30301A]|uniref:LapA family protein n=1 Tax=Pseudogracilibacillus sp. SO30301A TaxID=3098291 RepID=UPI00300E5001
MKGQTYVILAISFIILISIFAVLNVEVVEVNYLFWSGTSPLVFVILFSVLLGGVVTAFVSMKKYYELKRENKRLRQQIISLETELEEFKTSSLSSETDNNN